MKQGVVRVFEDIKVRVPLHRHLGYFWHKFKVERNVSYLHFWLVKEFGQFFFE